jgi:hypothetical protein
VTASRTRRGDRSYGRAPAAVHRGQAGLLLVILLTAILTVVGIALSWVTDSERLVAAHEWAGSRAFYAADSGARWASEQMLRPAEFLARPEFQPSDPFGTVRFPMPAHSHGGLGPFSGDPAEKGIRVEVEEPGSLGMRPCIDETTGLESGRFFHRFEVRVRAAEDGADARYARRVGVDVEIGPLPADFFSRAPAAAIPGGTDAILAPTQPTGGVPGRCESEAFRSVVMNWREP